MIVPKYFEDLNVLHKNTMPNVPITSRIGAHGSSAGDERDIRPFSSAFRRLEIPLFREYYDVKEEFFQDGYDTATFEEVKVPGVWQNYGYDHHQYTNVRYPFRWIRPMFLW